MNGKRKYTCVHNSPTPRYGRSLEKLRPIGQYRIQKMTKTAYVGCAIFHNKMRFVLRK